MQAANDGSLRRAELFDDRTDPDESGNHAGDHPEAVRESASPLGDFGWKPAEAWAPTPPPRRDDATGFLNAAFFAVAEGLRHVHDFR